jgi:nitroreductase
MLDTIFKRRSIRQYTGEPVSDEQVQKLLEAAMAAPTAANRKPWHFIVVRERAHLDALAKVGPWAERLTQAGLAVIVCGDPAISDKFWVQDGVAATENLLLAVTALGLGAVWMGLTPGDARYAAVAQALGVPDNIGLLNVIAVGHPAEQKEARTQFDPARVHQEKW